MIVAAAQIRSTPGDVRANIDLHAEAITLAARHRAGMVVFPELSLTGYEPTLAEPLALEPGDERLRVFRALSERFDLVIGIGIPTKTDGKPRISQRFFWPGGRDALYSKRHLHEDEWPFFEAGNEPLRLKAGGETVVPAICYEALLPEHAACAAELSASVYAACVAKSERGVARAHRYLPEAAKRHRFAVVMCNAVGPSDDFVSAGRSAAWNREGEMLACAAEREQCVLVVDLASDEAKIEPL